MKLEIFFQRIFEIAIEITETEVIEIMLNIVKNVITTLILSFTR